MPVTILAELLRLGVPILGVCYGMQLITHLEGGRVEAGRREYGRAQLKVARSEGIFAGFTEGEDTQVWMSHGDHVVSPPKGYEVLASSDGVPYAAFRAPDRPIFGVQFHVEVAHTVRGEQMISNFLFEVCGCEPTWTAGSFIDLEVERIRSQVGDAHAICGLSGGVDSSVAAALLQEQGHEVVGVTMKLWGGESDSGCCSVSDVDDARRVADELGIDHHVFNFGDDFARDVIEPYVAAHAEGRTPNPCIECNRHLKFDRLLRRAGLPEGSQVVIAGLPVGQVHDLRIDGRFARDHFDHPTADLHGRERVVGVGDRESDARVALEVVGLLTFGAGADHDVVAIAINPDG